jgi:BirA family transcriptional regulator, biotin operon repressor / biotin---[acetyl-CoA-carboxylase] ligase
MSSSGSRGAVPTVAEVAAGWPREEIDLPLMVETSMASTQRFARCCVDKLLAEDEEPPSFVVAALEQTAGLGRRGRSWQSAPGLGVWATIVLRVARELVPSIPMRAGVALAEACAAYAPGVRLKWPNDLVCDDRKLGGLLIDAVGPADGDCWVLIGFGIDCFHEQSQLPGPEATSLALAGREARSAGGAAVLPGLTELLPSFVHAVMTRVRAEDDWLARYRELSVHAPGDAIVCALEEETVDGRFLGFDERGFLRLSTPAGERVLSSGDVFSW